uniref:Predicted tetratricopeptide repeat protein n=1 Tax=Trypanosoma congolense (strain IL3000) TaxID=1068625 RepID=G0UU04_TRYCI|nr:predicted tetratricopeptide repeat protein [Trypanosoma congolense IL3000]
MPSLIRTNYALMLFYAREKLWRHAELVCSDTIKTTDSWIFRVWRALCYDKQGQPNEALREYKAAQQRRETVIPALMGIVLIYRRSKDTEGLAAAERALEAHEGDDPASSIDGWVQAATMTWVSGDVNGARDILLRFQDSHNVHRDECTNLATVRAWVDLSMGRGAFLEKCGSLFHQVMEMESQNGESMDIDATMGRVAFLERKCQFFPAQQLLNKLIVSYPNFTPALVVKARHLMKAEDWEQCAETTKRILAKDKTNLDALGLNTLFLLVKDARYEAAAAQLPSLLEALQEKEPKNATLFFEYAQCFARLGGAYPPLLDVTILFAEAAHRMAPQNSEYLSEVGYQQLLRGDYKTALATFKKASSAANSSVAPLLGLIRCLICTGSLDEAAKQIEFPNEIQEPNQRNPELSALNAILNWRRERNQVKALHFLDQTAEAIRQEVAPCSSGMELYIKLNPPLVLEVAKEYMQHCRTEPPDSSWHKVDPIAERCKKHLELLLRHVPGCLEGQLLLSKVYFVTGNLNKAQSMITTSIRHEHALPDAFLLSAQICQYIGNVSLASQALEQALTLDFEVKDQPLYNLLHGSVLGMMNKHKEALGSLQEALRITKDKSQVTSKGRPVQPLSVPDHVSLYLLLAQNHLKLHDVEEARNVVAEATALFKDTAQAGRVAIANAMIAARTDVDKALEILRQVPPRSEFFIAAKTRMANIYLIHRQNRQMYAECFEQLVEDMATAQSYIALGDAYTTIQEPEKAISAYEKAKAMDPENSELAVLIGRALVSTHDYQRAIRYYRDAVAADKSKFAVRADLATLFWHLGAVDHAITVLKEAPAYQSEPDVGEGVERAIERVNCALLMCKINRDTQSADLAAEALLQARGFQEHVLRNMMRNETRETIYQQKVIAATISLELGRYYASVGEVERAKECYQESRMYDESSEAPLLASARLLLQCGDENACEEQCNAVLRINPSCEEAVVILADLMIRRNCFDDAANHFSQLLDKTPNNYDALVQYINLLRQAGRLSDAKAVLERAEGLLGVGQRPDPALSFARGLYHRYNHESTEALCAFNAARLRSDDAQWSEKALVNIIEMYLVPTNEELWVDTQMCEEDRNENVKVAERLLIQMPPGDTRDILQAYCWLASKKRQLVERAAKEFSRICASTERNGATNGTDKTKTAKKGDGDGSDDEDNKLLQGMNETPAYTGRTNVHARVGLAIAHYISGHVEKAAKDLSSIVLLPFDPATGDSVHRARLLSAHISLTKKDFKMARVMLQKALEINKSCPRVHLLMGATHEGEDNHTEAAQCYEEAWKLTKERDPSVGYKLAFHQMKSGKLLQAIEVCRKVMEAHPAYPRISDVVDVCRSLLRP